MGRREAAVTAAVVIAMAAAAWLLSGGGATRLSAQLQLASGTDGDDGPVTIGSPVRHGTIPDQWAPRIPARAHPGPHRMYRHPRSCSPQLTAPHQRHYDWLYSPPSEGDL